MKFTSPNRRSAAEPFSRQLWKLLTLTPVTTAWWLAALALSACVVGGLGLSWWAFPALALLLLAAHEVLAFGLLGRGLFPSAERTARSYQWGAFFMDGYETAEFDSIGDLTEGYFAGDDDKSIAQATRDKYAEVVRRLGLKPGHRVLDVGCGLGDFLAYLRTQGIEGVGLTVSPDQYAIGRRRGLDVRLHDAREPLPPSLRGAFDAVTFFGCLEHFVESYAGRRDRSAALAVYREVFAMAHLALSPSSPARRVFSSTLHLTRGHRWTLRDRFHTYLLHGHYSGYYPPEGLFEEASAPLFSVCHRYDASADYQQSSLTSPFHFGNFRVRWTARRLALAALLFAVNPFAWATWLYHALGTWMWQFGGLARTAAPERPTTTLWYVYEAR